MARINNMLSQHDVLVVDSFFCHWYNKAAPVSERKSTLLIYSNLKEEKQSIENRRQAVWQVRSMLQQQSINDIAIEIIDLRIKNKIKTDMILPNENEVLHAWTELAPRVVECLSSRDWLSLDLLHRSWIGGQEDAKATVVVCAADANDNLWWDETMPALQTLLPTFSGIKLVYLDTIRTMDESTSFKSSEDENNILDMPPYNLARRNTDGGCLRS